MTLEQIKTLVISVDPAAAHYESAHRGTDAYTVWFEVQRTGMFADNHRPDKSWRFQIDRFTKTENDPVAEALEAALDAAPGVIYDYLVDYEPDTGYIHHIFDCQGVGA